MEMSRSVHVMLVLVAACAFVQVSESMLGGDMQVVLGEIGMELPPMPPSMPQSLREHLYPQERQRKQLMLLQQQQQREAVIRTLQHQRQQQLLLLQQQAARWPKNPYSVSYTSSYPVSSRTHGKAPLINSAANAIPSYASNSVGSKEPVNPYSISRLGTSLVAKKNPYLTIKTARPSVAAGVLAPRRVLSTIKYIRDQPKRMRDASLAGCKTPFESPAAAALLMGSCKNRNARMVCQSMMMTCNDVGMMAMCCPYGMNKLAMDTISYVNKMQRYMADMV